MPASLGPALLAIALASGCAARYRPDFSTPAIHGTAIVQARDGSNPTTDPWSVGGQGVTLAPGRYSFAMRFDVATPQTVEWTVTCPDAVEAGSFVTGQPGRFAAHAVITTAGDGICAVTATSDDGSVAGSFLITPAQEGTQEGTQVASNDEWLELNEGVIDYTPDLGVGDNLDGALAGLHTPEPERIREEREHQEARTVRVYRRDPPPTLTIRDKEGDIREVPWTYERKVVPTAPPHGGSWGAGHERREVYEISNTRHEDPDAKNDTSAGTFVRPSR